MRRDQTGTLSSESPEELQSLSQKAGLQSPPLTAQGASGVGANPHQIKMIGTPQQKTSALAQASQPGQSLQDTLRQGQGNERSQATGAEASTMEKSRDLQNLGNIGDRVAGFVDAQRAKLQAAATANTPVEVQAAAQFNGKDVSQIKGLLAQLRAAPGDQNLQLQVNQALGYDTKQQLSPDQINQLYQSATEAISSGAAGNVANDLTVEDLTQDPKFGYDSAELAHLLGLPEDQVKGMNIQNIRDQIQRIQADEYSNTTKLEQQAQSGSLGGAERALARTGAREASRVGTRSTEADMQHLEEQIANADQVSFGGKQYSVEDLLKDDNISGIVSNYLDSAEGSAERAQLEQTEPQLVEFIKKNQNLLSDAASRLSAGAQEFGDIQKSNQAIAASLPANLAKIVAPEAGSLQASRIDVSKQPILQYLQQNPNAAQYMQGVDDQDAQALSALNGDQLNQLFSNGGAKWKEYNAGKEQVTQLKARAVNAKNSGEVMDLLFGGKLPDWGQARGNYADQVKGAALGFPNSADEYANLDADHDGKLDDPAKLKDTFMRNVGDYSLQDALAGKSPGGQYSVPSNKTDSWDEGQRKLYNALQGGLEDGRLDSQELIHSGLSIDELLQLNRASPALKGQDNEYMAALAGKVWQDVQGKPPAEQYATLQAAREKLGKAVTDKGMQGSKIQELFAGPMSGLTAQMDKSKSDATAAAKAASDAEAQKKLVQARKDWDKRWGDVKQIGQGWFSNGMPSPKPPPRP